MYIKVAETCDYCGELARAPIADCFPIMWPDGGAVLPIKSKSAGTKCRTCRYSDFDDFCASQGVSALNPVLHVD